MKTILLSTAAALIAASAASAQDAASKLEVGAGYTLVDGDGVEFDTLTVRGGYDFTEFFGVEGEALFGLGDEDVAGLDASLNYGLGAYLKAQYPLADAVSVFGRVGYTWVEAELEGFGSDDSDGLGYGAGVEYAFAGPNAVRVEYTRYDLEDDAEADAYSVSYVRRF
ncbi:MAG: porin family protein [Oceanicaulis sp.]